MTDGDRLPLVRPWLPPLADLGRELEEIWRSGMVTTGPVTAEFERAVSDALDVAHVVMVDHGMTALMLAVRALRLEGEVIVPSFTWTATAGALAWNGVEPVFADVVPGRLTLDPESVEAAITPRTTAIMPVNVFGVPPDVEALEAIGRRHGLPILYDSAQGLGSRYRGVRSGGFGAAECFSLSPTKVVTAVEGGLVTTGDDAVADAVRSMRDSGKAADGSDITRIGLSGRPSELHAAIGLRTLDRVEALIAERQERIGWYRELLGDLPGLRFQAVPDDVRSTGNYAVVLVDAEEAPVTRSALESALSAAGIQSKRYFYPAVHLQHAYEHLRSRYEGRLPVTEKAAAEGLALPLYSAMTRSDVERVAGTVRAAFGMPVPT